MDLETRELPVSQKIEDLSGTHVEVAGRDSILVNAEVLGADQWREMVDETQKDFKERGLIVSKKRKGSIVKSKIFISEGAEAETSITIPLSQELRGLILGRNNLVFVHTHAMPQVVDHLRTRPISDADLQGFYATDYRALIMLDRGGAHLLVPISRYSRAHQPVEEDLVRKVAETVKKNSGGTLDIVKIVSEKLASHGLGYFYTPELDQTDRGFVEFRNPRSL